MAVDLRAHYKTATDGKHATHWQWQAPSGAGAGPGVRGGGPRIEERTDTSRAPGARFALRSNRAMGNAMHAV